jgi:hypothetical protein
MKFFRLKCLLVQLSLCVFALVLPAQAQTLTHRYSFNDIAGSSTFADSVGGTNWVGTIQNPDGASPFLDGNKLQLDGFGDFGQVPPGIMSNYTQITVEMWADFSSNNPAWTRVFAFGSQDGNGNKNSGVDYCHYAGGNYQNLDASANGQDAYANNPAGLNGETNQHITAVIDPVNNTLYYYNGVNLVSTPHNNVPALAAMTSDFDVFGRSLYDGDPTLNGAIDEIRVYNGVVPLSQIALNDAAGPDNYITTPGTITALRVSSPANPIVVGQSVQQNAFGDFTLVTNLNLVLYGGVAYASGNPGIFTVTSNGVVKGVGPGTATLVATYGNLSVTNTLTIASVPATLLHRYSFTTDASDSVGGANGTLEGNATVSGGQVVLDGSDQTYVSLPGNVINLGTNAAVTFEAWATIGGISQWSHLFEFGSIPNNLIYCAPEADAGGFHEFGLSETFPGGQTLSWAHGWNNVTIHYTGVVDPVNSTLAVYTNGVLLQALYNATAPLSNITTNSAALGKSSYGDPFAVVNIDEFRIYTGALNPAQIAMSDKSGPNTVNFDPGALTAITVPATNYPAFSSLIAPVVIANYASLGNLNLLPNTMASVAGLVVSSSDTNIISVNSQNMLTTHRPGTVTLSATFQGKTSSATVRIQNQAVLTHRYSFTTDASDSVGGANGTLEGNATVSGGQVQLDGGAGDYVTLPPGLINTYRSATLDVWATIDSGQSQWSRLYQFADVGPATANEVYFAPSWDNPPDHSFMAFGVPFGGAFIGSPGNPPPLVGTTVHLTTLIADGSLDVYTNGVLYMTAANLVAPANQSGNLGNWLGYSPYGDPGILGSIDEFRIYQGRLSPEEIAASDKAGPDTPLSTTATLSASVSGAGTITLSWPVADAGFAVATAPSLSGGDWTTLTNAPTLVGNQWQLTVPNTGANQFFELVR